MKPGDLDRVRGDVPGAAPVDRSAAADRFERALRRGSEDDSGDDDEAQHQRGHADARERTALPPVVLQTVRRALEPELPDAGLPAGYALLDALLHDIAEGLRAGRRMPGDRWRLRVRLRPVLLESTELEIACMTGDLSVVLRTASELAYRRLAEALPALNAALKRQRVGENRATLFWVDAQELQ